MNLSDLKGKRVYVASPCRAYKNHSVGANMMLARHYCGTLEEYGIKAMAPHAYLPPLLDDEDPVDRKLALDFGQALLKTCDAMVVCGDYVSAGMTAEIRLAIDLEIPVLKFAFEKNVEVAKASHF